MTNSKITDQIQLEQVYQTLVEKRQAIQAQAQKMERMEVTEDLDIPRGEHRLYRDRHVVLLGGGRSTVKGGVMMNINMDGRERIWIDGRASFENCVIEASKPCDLDGDDLSFRNCTFLFNPESVQSGRLTLGEDISISNCVFYGGQKASLELSGDCAVFACSFVDWDDIDISGDARECFFANINLITCENVFDCVFHALSVIETPILLSGTMEGCTFDHIRLTNNAHLVRPNRDPARLSRCCFQDIRTSRADKELFEEVYSYYDGLLFVREKTEVNRFADRASCIGLDSIKSL